jgi:hypothetical protein
MSKILRIFAAEFDINSTLTEILILFKKMCSKDSTYGKKNITASGSSRLDKSVIMLERERERERERTDQAVTREI